MDLKGMKADKGCDEVGDHFELVTRADYASSGSSFDFCEDFSDVEGNFSDGYTKVKEEAEGSSSDFDLCEEFKAHSIVRSPSSSEDEDSGAVSELEFNCVNNIHDSTDCVRRLRAKEFYMKYAETMMLTVGILEMSDSEFKEMQLREIVKEHALPFLPAKSLARFRTVSKVWDRWIMSPFLAHKQSYNFRDISGYFYEQYNGDGFSFISLCRPAYGVPDPSLWFLSDQSVVPLARNLSIMSSSNGLLLCRTTDGDMTYYVCNPTTKQCKELPQPSCYHGEVPSTVLAFEPSVLNIGSHFKMVCAFKVLDEPFLAFEIYSSETNNWKSVEDLCIELTDAELKNNGFYFNGMVYWETTSNEVLAFDLSSEIHGVFPLPIVIQGSGTLAQVKGELCYVCVQQNDESMVEVSFYMGLGNMNLKRSISFDLGTQLDLGFHVLPGLSDDTVMINARNSIYSCNVNDQTVNTVAAVWSRPDGKYLPYVNSLVYIA